MACTSEDHHQFNQKRLDNLFNKSQKGLPTTKPNMKYIVLFAACIAVAAAAAAAIIRPRAAISPDTLRVLVGGGGKPAAPAAVPQSNDAAATVLRAENNINLDNWEWR